MKQYTFQVITDGSCDLPQALTTEKDIPVVPFYVTLGDIIESQKEGEEIPIREFYDLMVEHRRVFPTSACPSSMDFMDKMMPYVEANIPVICICITSKFSGSFQSAMVAKQMIEEDHPEAKIEVIDSTVDTVLQGQFVLEAVDMRDQGYAFEKAVDQLNELKHTGRIFFTVGNLRYLQHGGRIGKLKGMAGALLDIKPMITLKDGEIFPSGICRGRKNSMITCQKMLLEHIRTIGKAITDISFCIGYGYDQEEAVSFREMTIAFLKEYNIFLKEEDIPLYQIGATIGVHTGPYPLGFGVLVKHA